MNPTEGVRTSEFWRILFDFESKPGRYALILRQPRILFDNGRLLLQLCSGRVTSDMSEWGIAEDKARTAAKFFVKTAMLRQGTDYFTLLGIRPGFAEQEIKENYRLLMRLTHPDFANQADGWPEDAATRINRAYDVLSSETSRKNYERGVDMRAYSSPKGAQQEAGSRGSFTRYLAFLLLLGAIGAGAYKWWRSGSSPVASTATPVAAAGRAASEAQSPDQILAESVRRSLAGTPVQAPQSEPAPPAVASGPVAAVSAAASQQPVAVVQAAGAGVAAAAPSLPARLAEPRVAPVATPSAPSTPNAPVRASGPANAVATTAVPAPATPVVRPDNNARNAPEPVRSAAQPRQDAPSADAAQGATRGTAKDSVVPSQAPPKLSDVQPYLSGLISSMLSGREAAVLAMLDKPVQGTDGAIRFMRHYAEVVRGAEEVRMGSLQLKSHVEGAYLLIEGAVHFVLLDANRTPIVRELRIRAYYGTQGNQTHLAALYPG